MLLPSVLFIKKVTLLVLLKSDFDGPLKSIIRTLEVKIPNRTPDSALQKIEFQGEAANLSLHL